MSAVLDPGFTLSHKEYKTTHEKTLYNLLSTSVLKFFSVNGYSLSYYDKRFQKYRTLKVKLIFFLWIVHVVIMNRYVQLKSAITKGHHRIELDSNRKPYKDGT